MSEELDVLKEVVSKLDEARIPYMISGSMAMNFYATPRMTRDSRPRSCHCEERSDEAISSLFQEMVLLSPVVRNDKEGFVEVPKGMTGERHS